MSTPEPSSPSSPPSGSANVPPPEPSASPSIGKTDNTETTAESAIPDKEGTNASEVGEAGEADGEVPGLAKKSSFVIGKKRRPINPSELSKGWFVPKTEEQIEEEKAKRKWKQLRNNTDLLNVVLHEVRFVSALMAGVKRRRQEEAMAKEEAVDSTMAAAAEVFKTPAFQKTLVDHATSQGYLTERPKVSFSDPTKDIPPEKKEEEERPESPENLPSAVRARKVLQSAVLSKKPKEDKTASEISAEFLEFLSPEEVVQQKELMAKMRETFRLQREESASMDDLEDSFTSPASPMELSGTGKGLQNQVGHNNCFLNAVLQVLWHCEVFRANFVKDEPEHICTDVVKRNSCLFCAVLDLFTKYERSELQILPPELIRDIMAFLFEEDKRFQFGEMEDVVECFEAVLYQLHLYCSEDVATCSPPCFVHKTFSVTATDTRKCCPPCDTSKTPFQYSATVHYFSAGLFFGRCSKSLHEKEGCESMERCMHYSLCAPAVTCPHTGKKSDLQRPIMVDIPAIFVIGVSWPGGAASVADLKSFTEKLPEHLLLSDIFCIPGCGANTTDESERQVHGTLMGMCCYYGKHYTSYCIDPISKKVCGFGGKQ